MKKWGIALGTGLLIIFLYLIEMSKVKNKDSEMMPTLDELKMDETARNWGSFYRVRAKLIDGQSADFTIPEELIAAEGKEMTLEGAAVFFGNGCRIDGDSTIVNSLFLLPTLGLAEACVLQPDEAMRWTLLVNLKQEWVLKRIDMIGALVKVTGTFRIDTKAPYDAVFFLDNAIAELTTE